ncbi:SDR family NAD(P)-dependent oxidoreductase [Streptomyces sp. NPDC000987]|uniref:SDR family NAD(P)-dependent oxidoreductase n=1 Tax=Streptomyces sp. NPDC000987 TaxID=3154374 RepID=UPI003320B11C
METIRRLREQLDAANGREPLAVVGVGIRFPGGICDLDGYWDALAAGRNLVRAMPRHRKGPFGAEWDGLPQRGGYLDEVLEFDADHFGIGPREASRIDPQHRLLLEVASEALDDAALPPDRLGGLRAGLYVGITNQDYRDWMAGEPDGYWTTGNGHCFAAGRLTHCLGLTGPAVVVDTACSASLVAVHLAAQGLRRGECDLALAGGVNLVLSPRSTRLIELTRSLAPDGLCKTFDARANGFARGEGAGVVVLKRLADARRDGDRVHAVIHGSAVNQDGRSTGFTAPNVLAQTALLNAALADSGLTPADIGLLEAHGTGTALGDPIEMEAVMEALGRRNGGRRLHVGSVKTNLGHLESAAGVAGLVKAVLCLRHRAVPPLVNFRTLNPRIDLGGSGVSIATGLEPWAEAGEYAGVSSFGMGGTNAHVILGPAPAQEPPTAGTGGPVAGFEVSARTPEALRTLAARLAERLSTSTDAEYPAFAYTVTAGRARQAVRARVEAPDRPSAIASLTAIAAGSAAASAAVTLLTDGTPGDTSDDLLGGLSRRVMDLPAYPWQRQRLAPPPLPPSPSLPRTKPSGEPVPEPVRVGGGVEQAGLAAVGHPFLGALVPDPESDALTLTGRLSLTDHPWLADHTINGHTLFPGTGFLELALQAAHHTHTTHLHELLITTPLHLTHHHPTHLQINITPSDPQGHRTLRIHSRPHNHPTWTHHATATLHPHTPTTTDTDTATATATAWPPPHATPIDTHHLYEHLRQHGYHYGPAFQGLHTAWRHGNDIYADVTLPKPTDPSPYTIHPALLDACMHAVLAEDSERRQGQVLLPYVWSGVTSYASGASAVRVRVSPAGPDGFTVAVADRSGQPVLSVSAVTGRPVSADQPAAGRESDGGLLQVVDWQPVRADAPVEITAWEDLPADGPMPRVVVLRAGTAAGEVPDAVRANLAAVLGAVQRWLADARYADSRLVVTTRRAVAVGPDEDVDVAHAPVWGLVRAAQAENPGRIQLLDTGTGTEPERLLAVAAATEEPELALRHGRVFVPRLRPAALHRSTGHPAASLDPDGTVLVTGGTGGIGARLARRLVTHHGARRLLLVSRRGAQAEGAADLEAELAGVGAHVTVSSCDVADHDSLALLLSTIPAEHPLTAVVHAAGTVDNGLVGTQTPERIGSVLAPKADAAWYLHLLTRDLDLAAFVLVSSAGGLVLAAGQAPYAAANTFLDALAVHRHRHGLTATSLAYGHWDQRTGLGTLTDGGLRRMSRQGLPSLSPEEGVALLDEALATGLPALVPLRVDTAALRSGGSTVPAVLRHLAPPAPPRSEAVVPRDVPAFRRRMADLDSAAQEAELLDLVRRLAAEAIGHSGADDVRPEREFLAAGFDSLSSMTLRNSLAEATGLRLPPLIVFDLKNPVALARDLRSRLMAETAPIARQAEEPDRSTAGRTETLSGLFRSCLDGGKLRQGLELLRAAARIRPVFESAAELSGLPQPAVLAKGPGEPRLICLGTPMATSGPQQFVRLVGHLNGARDVHAVPMSGFRPDEPLPSSPRAAVDQLTQTVLRAAQGRPFALLGYSAGGIFARAVARRLEESADLRPSAVVMLDTYGVHAWGSGPMEQLLRHLYDRSDAFGDFDATRLSAMGAWGGVLPELDLRPVGGTDELFVQCTRPFPGAVADGAGAAEPLAAPWHRAQDLVQVDADHFSVLEEDSRLAAEVIERWLSARRAD